MLDFWANSTWKVFAQSLRDLVILSLAKNNYGVY